MPKVNPRIFRAYDIRGIYPGEINGPIAFEIGFALVEFLKKEFKKSNIRIVIGRDCRLSSPEIFRFFTRGAINRGANIVNIGLVPTDALYFALDYLKLDAGVMITASHNPPYYNGIKIMVKGLRMLDGDWGLPQIKNLVLKQKEKRKLFNKAKLQRYNICPDYIKYILSLVKMEGIRRMKVVIDAGNGVGSVVIKDLVKKLPVDLICLYCQLDGRFPNHPPNPSIKENIKDLCREVVMSQADFGLALDGDGDRTIFVDEKGEAISGDLIIALFARYYLKENAGSTVVYNLTCSKSVPEIIRQEGGRPIRTRTGHSFMKESCRKHRSILGGEISGHLCFKDVHYVECGGLTLLVMLEILSESARPLSRLIGELRRYYRLGEVNFEVADRQAAIKKVAKVYSSKKLNWFDGLTVEFKNWWFNLRSSNTEPLLRLVVEAKNKKIAEDKLKEIRNIIKGK